MCCLFLDLQILITPFGIFKHFSLKQQSADIHIAPLGHIILIPSQPVFAFLLNAECLAEKQTYLFDILCFDPIGARTTISRIPGEHTNHYTIDAVGSTRVWLMKVKKYIVEMTKLLSEENIAEM